MGDAVGPWSTEMPQHASVRNPFMLMISPEVVLAAIEKSERLGQLNRQLCRPLDRPAPTGSKAAVADVDEEGDDLSTQPE
jgi:hypothetical protein